MRIPTTIIAFSAVAAAFISQCHAFSVTTHSSSYTSVCIKGSTGCHNHRDPSRWFSNLAATTTTPTTKRTRTILLQMSLPTDDTPSTKPRQQRVLYGYHAMTAYYLAACCAAISKAAGSSNSNVPFVADVIAGPLMAAGMANCLATATKQNRLGSTMYKQLNLVMGAYGGINMLLTAVSTQWRNPFWYYCALLAFFTTVNSIEGYGINNKWKGDNNKDLNHPGMIQQTVKSMLTLESNVQSLFYLATTVTLGTLLVRNIMVGTLPIASRLSRLGKLWLLTGASLSLKMGADRGQLEGTTFIQLNVLLAYAFGAMAGT